MATNLQPTATCATILLSAHSVRVAEATPRDPNAEPRRREYAPRGDDEGRGGGYGGGGGGRSSGYGSGGGGGESGSLREWQQISAQKCCDVCVSVRSCLTAVSCMLQMVGWFGFWKCLGNGSFFSKIVRIDSSRKCGLVVSYQCGTGSLNLDWCCANHLGTFQSPEVVFERIL